MSSSSSSNQRKHQKDVLSYEVSNLASLKAMGYTIGKKIGEGTYSRVCMATFTRDGHKDKIACKIINKKNAGGEFIKRFLPREMKIVPKLVHPYIISVSQIYELHDIVYMFMDYCKNGDLLEYIRSHGPLGETTSKLWFRELVSAVEYLHNHNYAHRDLKCENILLTQHNTIKLGDFGFSRSCVDPENGKKVLSDTFCGSAAYAAPEILRGIKYDPKMYDMWALGCILFIMISASMPFDDCNIRKMLKSQLNKTPCVRSIFTRKVTNPVLTNLLGRLLEPSVFERATIKEVASCEWFKELLVKKCKRLSSASDNSTSSKKR